MNALMELVEVVEVFGLGQKVGLLAKRGPQLLDHAVQVNELIGVDELGNDTHHRADDIDVLRHNLLRTGALHLDGHILARHQTSAVHLRERCATKRIGIDRIEHLPRRRPYSSSRQRSTTSYGTGSTSERRRRSSSQKRCGRISDRLARICPILTNIGPSSSSRRRKRTGVRLSHTRYF